MNLLLVFIATGVVSDAPFSPGIGEKSLEYRAFRGSFTNDCRLTELLFGKRELVRRGVDNCTLDSGWRVAMETRLLGWKTCPVEGGARPVAMEIRLGFIKLLLFAAAPGLAMFSLSTAKVGPLLTVLYEGDGGGRKFVILRSGGLSLEGTSGGFFSAIVFRGGCL